MLPDYRGCSAVEWAILNDDKVGNTAHFMTEEYDEGPIIESEWYEFQKTATYQSIRIEVYRAGCTLAAKALRLISDKNMKQSDAVKQNPSAGRFWKPIPDEKMDQVIQKVINKNYKYQRL